MFDLTRRLGAGLLSAAALLSSACATTTRTPLAAEGGRPKYRIECMRVGECWVEAERACGGRYRTLARYDNWLSESDLPGLNERTAEHAYPRSRSDYSAVMPRSVAPYGPGFDSDRPLPITDVVVMCTDG